MSSVFFHFSYSFYLFPVSLILTFSIAVVIDAYLSDNFNEGNLILPIRIEPILGLSGFSTVIAEGLSLD